MTDTPIHQTTEANWPEGTEILHILPQGAWHDPAWIIGTSDAITALRDALNVALASELTDGRSAAAVFSHMAADGEGYKVSCRVVSAATMDVVPFGYTEDVANPTMDWPRWMYEGIAT